jgi:glutamate:GABA antiporter
MDQAPPRGEFVEETTELALAEKSKLVKSLSRLDMIGFTVCALVGLDTLGTVASNGAQGFTWLIVLAVVFVLPYALAMAEVGSAFTQEGGPYEWAKMAFGRFQGAIAAVLYWVTNPLWVGGSLAFIATEAWSDNIFKIHAGGAGDYLFKFLFIWFSIGVAIVSLKRGKWIPNLGALMRVVLLGLFTLTTIIYAIKHGAAGFAVKDLKPTGVVFFALVPLLLFNYVGFELQNGAAEEMEDPQRDVPLAIVRSGITGVLLYAIPIFAILVVLPAEKVTGIGGFLDAVKETFSVYGGASSFLLGLMTICFVGTLLTSGAVWMIGSDRILAVAAYDGAFPGFFGVFNRKFGTPVRVNTMSGIFATIFMVVAVAAFNGGQNSKFVVVLDIAISTTLISYLWVFPAVIKLRYTHGHVYRPYRIPGDKAGMWLAAGLTTFWTALGSFVAVFPGVLESLFGISYDFHDTWGVSRTTFEVLTLGTLAVVFGIAIVGYWLGRDVRRRVAVIPIEPGGEVPAPAAMT